MDQFIVSARKYRPDTFESVVGQSHVTETLKNAIRSNHLAQAFLFSGPRGVGKTTCARILAKTVNCFNRSEEIEACNECESCESFNEGHSLNIYELDAASNNGVDDIRNLIEQVRFAPQIGTKKVYIIDEVHMLSPAAFNAFLKTLEEPPSHAMFILATTEKHKIIPTVLSRCQIFDFNRIDNQDMVRSLEKIAQKENVSAENDALHLIAQKSDGSLRDALSMFDQMVTYSGNSLTYASVVQNLSILGTDYFFDATDHLVSGDISSALNLFNDILQKGFDGHNFILGLAEHMRNLLVAQDHRTLDLLNVGPQIKEKYSEQTLRVSAGFLLKALNLLSKADLNYKSAKNQRLLVEICLINLANLSSKTASSEQAPVQKSQVQEKPQEVKKKLTENTEEAPKSEVVQKDELVQVKVEEKEPEPTPPVKSSEIVEKEVEKVIRNKEVKKDEIQEVKTTPSIEDSAEKEIQKTDVKSEEPLEKSEEPLEKSEEPLEKSKEPVKQHVTSETPNSDFSQGIATGSLSISSFTEEEEIIETNEEEEGETIVRFKEAVNADKLTSSWNKLKKKYQSEGRMNLYTTLSTYEAQVVDDDHVVVTYDNESQAEIISREKQNILDFLRQDLKNDLLQLKLSISDKPYQKAFTDAEKLKKMIEKNPNINELKDRLDLDLM